MRAVISTLALALAILSGTGAQAELIDSDRLQIMQLIRDFSSRTSVDTTLERSYWVSQVALLAVALFAAGFAAWQVRELRRSREEQNFAAILERTVEHNWKIFENRELRQAVEIFAGLDMPKQKKEKELYWAARLVHMSHVILLQQVWVLSGKRKSEENLTGMYKNWQIFLGKNVASELSTSRQTLKKTDAGIKPKAYLKACADYWDALQNFEETDPEFVNWLKRIAVEKPC